MNKQINSIEKIIGPKFLKNIEQKVLDALALEDEGCYDDFIIADYKIESYPMHLLNFEGVIFRNVDFTGILWSSLSLTNVRFENCDLSNADFSGSALDTCVCLG